MDEKEFKYGRKVTLFGIAGNVIVSAVELFLGIIGRSSALIADAIHSLSDVGATTAVYVGLKYSSVPKDEDHPYGHGKIESIIALFLGILLAFTGAYLIFGNVSKISNSDYLTPEWYTPGAALFTIVVKEWMFRYTLKAGKRLHSPSISATAYHHRSDAFTSIGVFLGTLGAYSGYPILDPVAALIVAVLVLTMAFRISRDSIRDLTDTAMPEELRFEVEKLVEEWNSDYKIIETIGRRMGTRYHINLKIRTGPYIQAVDGVADFRQLEEAISRKIPLIQGVDIKGDVDTHDAAETEIRFKQCVQSALDKYSKQFRTVEALEYHFLPNQYEVHFNMIVDPEMSVGDAHEITILIEKDIYAKFQSAQVIIHIEPADK